MQPGKSEECRGGVRISAILLAAGASTRMGEPKQLLPWDGVPMVRRVALTLARSRVCEVVVVVGCRAELVREAVRGDENTGSPVPGTPITVVENANWAGGMATSVACGVRAADPDCDGFLVALSDHPAVEASVADALIDAFEALEIGARPEAVFVPVHRGRRGHPILLGAGLRRELAELGGPDGRTLAHVVRERVGGGNWAGAVEVDSPGVIVDLDTPEDYRDALYMFDARGCGACDA